MKIKSFTSQVNRIALLVSMTIGLGLVSSSAIAEEAAGRDDTGTDPRDFSSKFMPYYLYTELENDLEVKQLNLFGLFAFDKDFALTYDMPISKEVDFSNTDVPESTKNGIGDLGIRFFYKPESTQFETSSHMFGAEFTLPTANDDLLGSEVTIASPMYVYAADVEITGPRFYRHNELYGFRRPVV
jgi:hypothetical protein